MTSEIEQGLADWLADALPGETVVAGLENEDLPRGPFIVVYVPGEDHVLGEYFRAEAQLSCYSPVASGSKAAHQALEAAMYDALVAATKTEISGFVETATADAFSCNGFYVRGWERSSDGGRWESTLNVLFGIGPNV